MFRRFLDILPAFVLATTLASAQNPFVGKWRLDPVKSRLPDEMKIQSKGGDTYVFDFGGSTETIAVDGSDQPGFGETLLSVKAEAPDIWIVKRKKDGRLLISATWNLSNGGGTLTDHYRQFDSDGSTLSIEYVYRRAGGGSGFAGDWTSITETVKSPFVLEVSESQGAGLSFHSPFGRKNVTFDRKDQPNKGTDTGRGRFSSARRVDERTLAITDWSDGKVTDTEEVKLSSDLKSLTMTVHMVGSDKSNVLVFERN